MCRLFNQTCLNEGLLPNYTQPTPNPSTHTHTHITYIYIYIYIYDDHAQYKKHSETFLLWQDTTISYKAKKKSEYFSLFYKNWLIFTEIFSNI